MLHAIAIVTLGSITGQPTQTPESWLRAELQRPMPLQEVERAKFEFLVVRPKPRRAKADIAKDGTMPEFPGKSVTRHTLWSVGKDKWRFNSDFPGLADPQSQFSDFCENGQESWISTAEHLTVTRSEWGFPGEVAPGRLRGNWEDWSDLLLTGGLSRMGSLENELESFGSDDRNRFHAVLVAKSPTMTTRHHVDLEWSESAGRGFVRHRKVLSASTPGPEGLEMSFGPWKPAGIEGLWMTSRLDLAVDRHRDPWILVPQLLSQPSAEAMNHVLVPPVPGVPDAVRGESSARTFADYRTRKPLMHYGSAFNRSSPLPPLPGMDHTARLVAWITGVMVLFLACSVIARHRRTATSDRSSH